MGAHGGGREGREENVREGTWEACGGVTAWGCDGGSGVWSVQLQPYTGANGVGKEWETVGFPRCKLSTTFCRCTGRWGVGMEELLPALILGSLNIPVGTVHSLGVFPQAPFSPPG